MCFLGIDNFMLVRKRSYTVFFVTHATSEVSVSTSASLFLGLVNILAEKEGAAMLKASLVVLGTGTGTCEKVLVAKTKSFSAVIDTLWHLYSETLSVWTTSFYVQVYRLALFGGFAFHKFFDFQCLLNLR